jgi:hypothetical protein
MRIALQLADRRRNTTDSRDGVPGCCLGVCVSELAAGCSLSNYFRAATRYGATALWWALLPRARAHTPFLNLGPEARSAPGKGEEAEAALKTHFYAGTCASSEEAKAFAIACAQGAPEFAWADAPTARPLDELKRALAKQGYECLALPLAGRDLGDQIWWHRTVLAARWAKTPNTPCLALPEEGAVAKKWATAWKLKDKNVELWQKETLHLDSEFPFLGLSSANPAGRLWAAQGEKPLVWNPDRPLPSLHERSWDPDDEKPLLLVGQSPSGPAARCLTAGEAYLLLGGKPQEKPTSDQEAALAALRSAPDSLTDLAMSWLVTELEADAAPAACSTPGKDSKVGVCQLS